MEKFVIGKIYTLEEKTASNAPILAAREAKNGHSALYNALVNLLYLRQRHSYHLQNLTLPT